jgi:hypothetical protein
MSIGSCQLFWSLDSLLKIDNTYVLVLPLAIDQFFSLYNFLDFTLPMQN